MTFTERFNDLDIKLHGVRLPPFTIDEKYKEKFNLSKDVTNYNFLRALCLEAFKKMGLEKGTEQYKKYTERTKFEIETLNELGFIEYVLLVWDVINFCNEHQIPSGFGRGSAAGSLVLFFLGITKIDPIKYDLYFERFVSKSRAKKTIVDGITYLDGSLLPDVDTDVCIFRRAEVAKYLDDKYPGRSSKICTFTTLSGKLLIKECCKIVGGKSEEEAMAVAEMIPKIFGKVWDIEKTYREVENFRVWCDANREIYEVSLKLRDLIKNKGVHASAILLSYDRVEESVPTEYVTDKKGVIHSVSSYDMDSASILNIKLDLLGLRCVSVIKDVCEQIGISPDDIDLTSDIIFQNLQDFKTPHGIFQLEANTSFEACKKIKPKNIEELSGVMAIARPGALQYVNEYANYTTTGTLQSIHPFFDDILNQTGGLCLYQEQMMRIAHKIGFTLEEAETLRRIVGKKKEKEMPVWEQKVKDKVAENKLDPKIAELYWKILDASKDYSFNKSHAVAYASLSAATLYLKYKFPQQFYLSLLKMTLEENTTEEISKIHKELQHFNIQLLPPHILKSEMDFTLEGPNIRYGLAAIKKIGESAITKINQFRSQHSNKFEVFKAAKEAKLGIGVLSALIQAGALDGFKETRSMMVLEAQLWNILTEREHKLAFQFGETKDFNLIETIKFLTKNNDEKGKPFIKESRFKTIKKDYEPYRQIFELNSKNEDFANWFYEKKLLGYNYKHTLQNLFLSKCPNLMSIPEVKQLVIGEEAYFIGTVDDTHLGVGKSEKKTKYFRLNISDEFDSITVLVFNEGIKSVEGLNGGKLPEKESIVIVRGEKKGDAIFAKIIAEQTNQKVYTRLSELSREQKEEKNEQKV